MWDTLFLCFGDRAS